MAESRLEIKPVLRGSYKGGLNKLRSDVKKMATDQGRSLRSGLSDVNKLERGYIKAGRAASIAARGAGRLARGLTGIKSLVTGLVVGGAGKTFIEATIGSAAQARKSESVLKALIKDQGKFLKAQRAGRDLVKDVSSLSYTEALGGLEKTFVLSGKNIGKASQLVKVAKALENLSPEQGFEGALFALKELESGDTMSLRSRFGLRLPTRGEATKEAKKANKTLSDFYFDELTGFIDKRYGDEQKKGSGVEELLRIDRDSLSGRVKMLQTSFQDFFTTIGTEAEGVATNELLSLKKSLDKLQADPEFKQDIKDFAKSFAGLTRDAFQFAKTLPSGLKKARDFAKQFSTEIKTALGAFAINKATGGGLGSLLGKGLTAGGSAVGKKLFEKSGLAGKAASGALSKFGGATPVYVTNMDGGGGLLGRNTKKAGSASSAISLATGGGGAALAAGGVILGSAALGAATFYQAVNNTNRVVKAYERRAKEASKREQEARKVHVKAVQAQAAVNLSEANNPHLKNRRLLLQSMSSISTDAALGAGGRLRSGVNNAFGGAGTKFTGSSAQKFILKTLNETLSKSGQKLNLRKGQNVGDATLSGGLSTLRSTNPEIARKIDAANRLEKTLLSKGADGRFTPKNDVAARELERLEKSGRMKEIEGLISKYRVQSEKGKQSAEAFNKDSRGVRLNKVADKFEFHFHGVEGDTPQAQAAAKKMMDSVSKSMGEIFRTQAINEG